jgi:sulfide:quinone oxidoreductase
MPVAGKAVGDAILRMLAERGIDYFPGRKPKAIDASGRTVSYENGAVLPYDLLGAVPPHRAPRVVRDAGLADASGFVPVELGTFRTSVANVYAVGDVAAIRLPNGNPHPKAGVFAEAQALTVARNLAAEILQGPTTAYLGRGVCFVDVGRNMAAAAEIRLLAEGGPQARIEPPSAKGLEEKSQFERERFNAWFGG